MKFSILLSIYEAQLRQNGSKEKTDIHYQGGTFSILFNISLSLFRKGIHSKRKEFAPKGSKFFPYRIGLFSEVCLCVVRKVHFFVLCASVIITCSDRPKRQR